MKDSVKSRKNLRYKRDRWKDALRLIATISFTGKECRLIAQEALKGKRYANRKKTSAKNN